MTRHINLQKNYSLNQNGYQLKLPLNIDTIIPEDDSVRLLSQFVEAMDLTDLYSAYERINSVFNFMFLLEGAPAPDHATFARFRSIHFAPCFKRILAEMSNALFGVGEISGEDIFIDGTKIEAGANKYTIVWKKSVTKNQEKLLIKLADFVAECEQLYGLRIVYGNALKMKHVKKLRRKLYALKQIENIVFVHGIGKRKTPLQKNIETLENNLSRFKKYNQEIHICGERNSYSKTDHDAAFMRMKEDAMGRFPTLNRQTMKFRRHAGTRMTYEISRSLIFISISFGNERGQDL